MKKPKKSTFDKLARAVADYIEEAGGSALVVGGISIRQESNALKHNYSLEVAITGKLPAGTI